MPPACLRIEQSEVFARLRPASRLPLRVRAPLHAPRQPPEGPALHAPRFTCQGTRLQLRHNDAACISAARTTVASRFSRCAAVNPTLNVSVVSVCREPCASGETAPLSGAKYRLPVPTGPCQGASDSRFRLFCVNRRGFRISPHPSLRTGREVYTAWYHRARPDRGQSCSASATARADRIAPGPA